MLLGGLLIKDTIVMMAGAGIIAIGVIFWFVRAMHALWRHSLTPSLLFLSEDGIGAILPDTSSVLFPWTTLRARLVAYGCLRDSTSPLAQLEEQALVLTEPEGCRIYVTQDFCGYDELVAILNDYSVPITGGVVTRGEARGSWRGGWELSAGGFSN